MCRVAILLITLLFPGWSFAQSLGDVARKERERRDKNKNEGVEVREFSAGEIFGEEEEEEVEASESEAGETTEGEDVSSDGPVPKRLDIDIRSEENETLEDESRERKRREAEFRSRYRAAKERVQMARERKRVLDGIHYVPGVEYVDENGDVVIESLDHLRRLVSEAESELASAEQALKAIEEEARRGGYPKGWLR